MKGFKTVPSPQKYMSISRIYDEFGSRGVVAYSCKVVDSVLEGGVVIAVEDEAGADNSGIKDYHRQLRKKHPDKSPIYYLRVEQDEKSKRLLLTYDGGGGEKKVTPKLEVKKSEAQQAIEQVPFELLAQALSTSVKKDYTQMRKH